MRLSHPKITVALLGMTVVLGSALGHPHDAPAPPPADPASSVLRDLPLTVVPAVKSSGKWMAIHITGDGGWGITDKGLSTDLADHGIPVVGLNSLRYFWTERTPDGAAKDIERILIHFTSMWSKDRVVIIGYSMGADALPFLVNRLSPNVRKHVGLIVLIGLGHRARFRFHPMDWLKTPSGGLPVAPELEKFEGLKVLCFYGSKDSDALCPVLHEGLVESTAIEGGHRVGRHFGAISKKILETTEGEGSVP